MKYVNCNLCNADDTFLVTTQNGYKIVRCKSCGLVYVNPRPDNEALKHLYDEYHQRNGKDVNDWAKLMGKNFKEILLFLNKALPDKGKLLDIGCGYGHFIEIMKQQGWSVYGIDLSPKVLLYAKEKGLDVLETSIDDVSVPDEYFDVVTAFYVLEHVTNPLHVLKNMYKMLKPCGILVLRVPHTTPIIRILSFFRIKNNLYDTPYHLFDYSPEIIIQLLKKAGFSSVKVTPGSPTIPANVFEMIVSVVSGSLSKFLFAISAGKFLLPGISKTIFAFK
ncbi:MAG: class I SAM-dependent methyltransferase [Candidatus Brocadia sp.]|uniref:Methyltransferase n=1 Tax=Candidatus Brocadia fulgida TaxID=380242 RepID=A0A0M2UWV8_9BACT|nr:MAG: putative methyltransferase [Candidatus Brocadia fulgida]UJS20490.1 MAG: class I SAM-dependent methyltransferase [Candidatus Brocadia sp.]